jgi:hypothetical protein
MPKNRTWYVVGDVSVAVTNFLPEFRRMDYVAGSAAEHNSNKF